MYLWRDLYIGRNSYKEFTYIYDDIDVYGGIHTRTSHISMEGFINGVHTCLWRNLYVGSDSNKKFICICGGTHKMSSDISMEVFICREGFI